MNLCFIHNESVPKEPVPKLLNICLHPRSYGEGFDSFPKSLIRTMEEVVTGTSMEDSDSEDEDTPKMPKFATNGGAVPPPTPKR